METITKKNPPRDIPLTDATPIVSCDAETVRVIVGIPVVDLRTEYVRSVISVTASLLANGVIDETEADRRMELI